jgi:hypothetical protein
VSLRLALALTLALTANLATAQEFVTAKAPLSDEDFYRLVACAAPPGGACQKPFVRWSARAAKDLTVRIVQIDEGYPARIGTRAEAALDTAIEALNGAGANLRLRRIASGAKPDISVHLLNLPQDTAISGTGLPWFDGNQMEVARYQLGWHDNGTAFVCAIALSRDVEARVLRRVMLEELTQCLGLMTDIGGRAYEGRSIFSETSGQMVRLQGQDLAALRRHYP